MSDKQPPASPADVAGKSRAVAAKKAPVKKTPSKSMSATKAAGKKATPKKAASKTPAGKSSPVDLIRVPMAVRWRDLDAFNHVNNSKYLSYLEEARLHWMLRLPGQGMDEHVAPVVAAAQLNYRRPITWPAQVVVEMFVERLGNTSLSIGHRIVDDEDGSIVYCDGNVVLVWIDRDSGRPADLPQAVREACNSND